jgi:hypothetical protein
MSSASRCSFRLHGSLPANRPFPASNLTWGEAFVTMDLLDQVRYGPTFLRQPAIAQLVLASIEYGALPDALLRDHAQSRPSPPHASGERIEASRLA